MSDRIIWQDANIINRDLGPRNENQQMATQELNSFVNQLRQEGAYRTGNPAGGEREVQHLFQELREHGIAVQPQQSIALDQWNRQVPVTNYVPFRTMPQAAEPYYGTPPIAAVPAYPAPLWAPSPRCQGVDLGVRIPLGNGAGIGFNLPLVESCKREREVWERGHQRR